ncbi:MAG: RNA polymerase sigma factor [Candidatus Limnocylindrales bacterium]
MTARFDSSLVQRARERDPEAFEGLVRPRLERLRRIAQAILGHDADAGDALQDALTRAWQGLPGLRDPDEFDAWLSRILVNTCRTALKRRARIRLREIDLSPERPGGVNPVSPHVGPEAVLARLELEAAFDRLAADERAILVLHHLDGRPLDEIARILSIPVGTAKSRLYAARRSLERALRSQR